MFRLPGSNIRSEKTQPGQEDMRLLWKLSGIGFQLLAEILAGIGIGWLIDWWAGTAPRWITIGAVAGVLVGLANFVRQAIKVNKQLGAPPRGLMPLPKVDEPTQGRDQEARPGETAKWFGATQRPVEDVDEETFEKTLESELRDAVRDIDEIEPFEGREKSP